MNDPLSELLPLIYQGVGEEAPWTEMLDRLQGIVGADAIVFIVESPNRDRPGVVFSRGGTAPAVEAYKYDMFADDPFRDLPTGMVTTVHEHLGIGVLEATPFFTQYMRQANSHYLLGMDIVEPSGVKARLRASRDAHRCDFGAVEKSVFAALAPHLTKALALLVRLLGAETERDLYAAALDRLTIAAILVGRTGKIFEANSIGREMIGSGRVLRSSHGILRLNVAEQSARLLQEIEINADAAERKMPPPPVRAVRLEHESQTYALIVRPAPPPPGFVSPVRAASVVIVSELDHRPTMSADVLIQLFGLTPVEASLSIRLAEGHDLDGAAQLLGMSRNTARHHLRAIFPKVGVSRQSELIRLVMRSLSDLA